MDLNVKHFWVEIAVKLTWRSSGFFYESLAQPAF